jgi:hypothetical protein
MADVISGGPSDEPPQRGVGRRVVTAAIVLVLVAVGGYTVTRESRDEVAPTPTPSPGTSDLVIADDGDELPTVLSGGIGGVPDGLRLLVGGSGGVGWLDGRANDVRPEAAVTLAPGEDVVQLLRIADQVAMVIAEEAGSSPGRVILLGSSGGSVQQIATADWILAAPGGAGLLTVLAPPTENGQHTVQLISLDGTPGPTWTMPPFSWPVATVSAGLLAQVPDGTPFEINAMHADVPQRLALLDATTGQELRSFGEAHVVATADDRFAWTRTAPCNDQPCPVVVEELRLGTSRSYSVDVEQSPWITGAFSPNGAHLAVVVAGAHAHMTSDGEPAGGFVSVLDLASGDAERIRGLATPPKHGADVSWSPDGVELALSVPWDDKRGFAFWSIQLHQLTVLPAQPPGEPYPFAMTVVRA